MSESHTTTSAATLLSSEHSRMRRAQRLIEKRDLQAALRWGTPVASLNQRGELCWKYTFKDVVFIVDETKTREITCWAQPGAGLDTHKQRITEDMVHVHRDACMRLKNTRSWTSHTVIVVDQSGSMRKTDVSGGATRSDAVWLTLAIDFIAKQIDNGQSTATDVVSVIGMGIHSSVLIDRQPHDWLLFNSILDLLRNQEPYFEGNYMPALDAAEKLLLANEFGACALALFFLSDGKPSDQVPKGHGGAPSSLEMHLWVVVSTCSLVVSGAVSLFTQLASLVLLRTSMCLQVLLNAQRSLAVLATSTLHNSTQMP